MLTILVLVLSHAQMQEHKVDFLTIFESCLNNSVSCDYSTNPAAVRVPTDTSYEATKNVDNIFKKYNEAAGIFYVFSYDNTRRIKIFCDFDNYKCTCEHGVNCLLNEFPP